MGLSSGAQTKPVQDYPPRDKVCDYHEKTASSSPIAKDCQACWRGGPPLISCREMLNTGAHSPPYAHTQKHNDVHKHSDMPAHTDTHMQGLTGLQKLYTIMNFSYFGENIPPVLCEPAF